MDTDSTPTPELDGVPEHLRTLYRNLTIHGHLAKRESERTAQERADEAQREQAARRASEWAPVIQKVSGALPPALREFIIEPTVDRCGRSDGALYYNPVIIAAPAIPPIYAWYDFQHLDFEAARWECVEVDDGVWEAVPVVRSARRYEYSSTARNFDEAFADAVANIAGKAQAEAEAARRNAIAAQLEHVDLTPEQEAEIDAMKRGEAAAVLFNCADNDVLAAGLLLIAHELHRVNDNLFALYDRSY